MLSRNKTLKHTYGKKVRLLLAGALGSLLLTIFTINNGSVVSALSQQDMENIFGGLLECYNFDDCNDVYYSYDECFHIEPYPQIPNCDVAPHACIKKYLSTDSCQPNQGEDAEGCDTSTQDPEDYMILQEIYNDPGGSCFWLSGTYSVYTNIYFGCDYGVLKTCAQLPIWWACGTPWCPGTYWPGYDNHIGVRYYCAVCS